MSALGEEEECDGGGGGECGGAGGGEDHLSEHLVTRLLHVKMFKLGVMPSPSPLPKERRIMGVVYS